MRKEASLRSSRMQRIREEETAITRNPLPPWLVAIKFGQDDLLVHATFADSQIVAMDFDTNYPFGPPKIVFTGSKHAFQWKDWSPQLTMLDILQEVKQRVVTEQKQTPVLPSEILQAKRRSSSMPRFCSLCGAPNKMYPEAPKLCPRCGNPYPAGAGEAALLLFEPVGKYDQDMQDPKPQERQRARQSTVDWSRGVRYADETKGNTATANTGITLVGTRNVEKYHCGQELATSSCGKGAETMSGVIVRITADEPNAKVGPGILEAVCGRWVPV